MAESISGPSERQGLGDVFKTHRLSLVSALTAQFRDIGVAETALAEACLAAQSAWITDPPSNPAGWLYRVACRKAIDAKRRDGSAGRYANRVRADPTLRPDTDGADEADKDMNDHRLGLFFGCAHPALAQDAQMALILYHLIGWDSARIAKACLTTPNTIQQRLKRSRDKMRLNQIAADIPPPDQWQARLSSVLSALEIIYNGSYSDLLGGLETDSYAREALMLCTVLTEELLPTDIDVLSLSALLFLCEARRPARLNRDGEFVPLSEQSPKLWSAAHIKAGAALLSRASDQLGKTDQPVGQYLLRAQIQASHINQGMTGQNFADERRQLYDVLYEISSNPIVGVNRALAIVEVESAEVGLDAINALEGSRALTAYAPWHLARADLLERTGQPAAATQALKSALTLITGQAERDFVRKKLDRLCRSN